MNQIECTTPSLPGFVGKADVEIVRGTKSTKQAYKMNIIGGIGYLPGLNDVDRSLANPTAIKIVGQKMLVTDSSNNRLLIWNSIPTSHETLPDIIIGQPSPGFGGLLLTQASSGVLLRNPGGVWTDGTRVALADSGNHRVLIWHQFPTSFDEHPDVVLGQANFTDVAANNGPATPECGGVAGRNACSFSGPHDILFADGKLLLSDRGNHRLLVWNDWPTTNQQPANAVVGQPNFLSGTANSGPATPQCGVAGRNACSFSNPSGFSYDGTHFIIADSANHRVLLFNTLPIAHGTPASIVIGQSSFTAGAGNSGGLAARTVGSPSSALISGSRIFVSDTNNNRVLGWNSIPSSHFTPADIVIGQSNFTTGLENQGGAVSASTVKPQSLEFNEGQLWVVDRGNHRLLRYDTPTSFASANMVWGHSTFTINDTSLYTFSSETFNKPSDVYYDGEYFIVTDRMNSRVIIQRPFPYADSPLNRIVLGQPDLNSRLRNNGPASPECGGVAGLNRCSLSGPLATIRIGQKLVVADFDNRRVLIWNSIPTQNQQPADVVLGQPDFVSSSNIHGCTNPNVVDACSVSGPSGFASDGTKLILADLSRHRLLIWNTVPTANQTPADLVLGQPDFSTSGINNGPASPACGVTAGLNRCSVNRPYGMSVVGQKLLVADTANNRVLIWNSIPTTNQQPADVVLGQPDFYSDSVEASQTGMHAPLGICSTESGKLAVSDSDNNRILIYDQVPTLDQAAPSSLIGQPNWISSKKNAGQSVSISAFNRPYGISCSQENIFVSDYYNSRILIFSARN